MTAETETYFEGFEKYKKSIEIPNKCDYVTQQFEAANHFVLELQQIQY